MSLVANTVDLNATSFERADKITSCYRLCSIVFQVIVIVIQLGIWVIFGGGREGNGDEFRANLKTVSISISISMCHTYNIVEDGLPI
jgi:hypothetical protein